MDTNNQSTSAQTTGEQGANTAPQRKGGFVQGAVVAQGCCGETSSSSSGCCGAPAQAAAPTARVQLTTEGGCCGTTAPKAEATRPASGCCG